MEFRYKKCVEVKCQQNDAPGIDRNGIASFTTYLWPSG